jgi:hypothetical protein
VPDGSPSRIHTVTAGYLRGWEKDGCVTVHHVGGGMETIGVKAVGYQHDYWGPDPRLSQEVEDSFGQCETRAVQKLRDIKDRWPVNRDDRADVAQFVAIHIVRTPSFGVLLRRTSDEAITAEAARERLAPEAFAAAAKLLKGPRMQASALLGQITRIGSILGSMQWSLLRFERAMLITSDQPVCLLPLASIPPSPASAVPEHGFLDTIEVWFPVDPRHLLLMTWRDAADAGTVLDGTYQQACSVNCWLRAQALEEWVSTPGSAPPFLMPPVLTPQVYPLSSEMFPGYTASTQRRATADKMMTAMIEEDAPRDMMRWVTATSAK